jgi:hypothetical protein
MCLVAISNEAQAPAPTRNNSSDLRNNIGDLSYIADHARATPNSSYNTTSASRSAGSPANAGPMPESQISVHLSYWALA